MSVQRLGARPAGGSESQGSLYVKMNMLLFLHDHGRIFSFCIFPLWKKGIPAEEKRSIFSCFLLSLTASCAAMATFKGDRVVLNGSERCCQMRRAKGQNVQMEIFGRVDCGNGSKGRTSVTLGPLLLDQLWPVTTRKNICMSALSRSPGLHFKGNSLKNNLTF